MDTNGLGWVLGAAAATGDRALFTRDTCGRHSLASQHLIL